MPRTSNPTPKRQRKKREPGSVVAEAAAGLNLVSPQKVPAFKPRPKGAKA